MTEQIKRAISIIENEKECVQSGVFCDRDCANCKLVKEESEIISAFDTALRSLKAWEEVLNELENMRDIIWQDTDNDARIVRANAWDKIEILVKAIDIIKQKLEEIEE